jgi:aspartate racemase
MRRGFAGGRCGFIVLCTNTMHKVAPAIEAAVQIPLFHIADPTAQAIQRRPEQVGLLGTSVSRRKLAFYAGAARAHGPEVVVPDRPNRDIVHRIIYDELCLGRIVDASR